MGGKNESERDREMAGDEELDCKSRRLESEMRCMNLRSWINLRKSLKRLHGNIRGSI